MPERAPTLLDMPAEDIPPPAGYDDTPIGPARPRDKVVGAVMALAKAGKLRPWHNDREIRELAEAWLRSEGWCECSRMPGDGTWKRELPRLRHLWRPRNQDRAEMDRQHPRVVHT
jgi:hypothetical protein